MDDLEKIDLLRCRMDMSYQEAAHVLQLADGSVVEALILAESRQNQGTSSWELRGREVMAKIRALLREGNITKITIFHDDRPLLVLPVTVGVMGAVFIPKLALLATSVCLLGRCRIQVERDQSGESVDEV